MHERHVRECCLWLITSRTTTFQLPINKADPAAFQRLCCGNFSSRVPPGALLVPYLEHEEVSSLTLSSFGIP